MKLFYFRDVVANFGDELNPWLFSRLLPNMLDEDERELLLGIGSILFDNFPPESRKIVFGSGYAGYRPAPVLDDGWKIYFVRGPRSARAIGIDAAYGMGDGATLLRIMGDAIPAAGPPLGPIFIPHWESALDGVWDRVAADAGLTYVDPRWSVERIITAIRSSSLVVSEAMHGAIVADAMRVPWVPVMPLLEKHRFKWFDWAESLNLSITFTRSSPSSWIQWAQQRFRKDRFTPREATARSVPAPPAGLSGNQSARAGTLSRARTTARRYKAFGGPLARMAAVCALKRAAASEPYLSRDSVISRVTERMEEQLALLRLDLSKTRRLAARVP